MFDQFRVALSWSGVPARVSEFGCFGRLVMRTAGAMPLQGILTAPVPCCFRFLLFAFSYFLRVLACQQPQPQYVYIRVVFTIIWCSHRKPVAVSQSPLA